MLDKIKGGLFGLAIGDALGGTTEFMTREEIQSQYGKVTDIIGGGVWNLEAGETTDDTAMTIAVAEGIIKHPKNPIEDIGREFKKWESTNPKDIGSTIYQVFQNYQGDWFQAAKQTHEELNGKSAGNGSLMRCLPIALAYTNTEMIDELSRQHSKMTHYDEEASEACVIYNHIAKRVLDGENLQQAIQIEIKNTQYEGDYKKEPNCPADGYVVHTMRWVLYWLINSSTFEEVVVGATNVGNDSDTVAAIAGGLKGVEVGYEKLPTRYKDILLNRSELEELAEKLQGIRF
ncbi:ADP-ribosylglycohydrolase family protein [Lysinibacillus antri]|uniref:ADP-ribosylglycohydrolase family protein n=1 Tax=Lysinibacillus antri TaxID=2498145 RepID=A0A3S0RHY5_9BACI|nr:ADP-ribosylglycohydrolase family protein [Lysinibacillus antri]RUL49870.1 ADP-ribosylglycohydrolase family protein [Lysinibacillus antri]